MISVDRANAYFRTRTVGARWDEYATGQKEAALAQAQRELARALGRSLVDDESVYTPGSTRCDTYAVYEQAVYSLLRDVQPTAPTKSDLPSLDQDTAKRPSYTLAKGGDWLSAEARRWLGIRQQTRISMG
ncbi:MAG: hypothetical protein ACI4Q3_00580 [Kiritimatiellia bacterium]